MKKFLLAALVFLAMTGFTMAQTHHPVHHSKRHHHPVHHRPVHHTAHHGSSEINKQKKDPAGRVFFLFMLKT
jgi:hypothetical protein